MSADTGAASGLCVKPDAQAHEASASKITVKYRKRAMARRDRLTGITPFIREIASLIDVLIVK